MKNWLPLRLSFSSISSPGSISNESRTVQRRSTSSSDLMFLFPIIGSLSVPPDERSEKLYVGGIGEMLVVMIGDKGRVETGVRGMVGLTSVSEADFLLVDFFLRDRCFFGVGGAIGSGTTRLERKTIPSAVKGFCMSASSGVGGGVSREGGLRIEKALVRGRVVIAVILCAEETDCRKEIV